MKISLKSASVLGHVLSCTCHRSDQFEKPRLQTTLLGIRDDKDFRMEVEISPFCHFESTGSIYIYIYISCLLC